MTRSASDMIAAMAAGETTSRALVSAALDRILDPAGEGARVFTAIEPDTAI